MSSRSSAQLLALLAAFVCAGCGSYSIRYEPTASSVVASLEDVADGEWLYPFVARGQAGYMDSTGVVVIAPMFDAAAPFSEGRAAVRVQEAWGYVDPTGRLVVPIGYASAEPFSQGRAVVTSGSGDDLRYGFIDPDGVVLVPTVLHFASSYSDGLALVRFREVDATPVERMFGSSGPSQGYIDRSGRLAFSVVGPALPFSEELAPYASWNWFRAESWGYRHLDGSVAVPPGQGGPFLFYEGLARVIRDGRIGYVGKDGQPAFEATFDVGESFSEGRAAVLIDDAWGYIDRSGGVVIAPQFERALTFSDGLAAVRRGGRWGYIDPSGRAVITPAYQQARPFRGPLALITDASGSHYIERQGRVVRPAL